jgi:hypothetical protein
LTADLTPLVWRAGELFTHWLPPYTRLRCSGCGILLFRPNGKTIMTLKCLLLSVGVLAIGGATAPLAAQEGRSAQVVTTAAAPAKARTYAKKRPPIEIDIYAQRRRVGGYSYRAPDVTSTYNSRNPPPYMHVRQTPSGPFDSGFFFDSACCGLHGGDAPYPH